jgi:hypothetical protein
LLKKKETTMPSAQDATLEYEVGQTPTPMSELTDSGDHQTYTSAADLFSGVAGFAPVIRPNGVITGGAVTPAISAGNDAIDTAALTVYLAGVKTLIASTVGKALTRGASTNTHIINSLTITSAGVITVIAGTAHTAFSEVRGAIGAPPFIPVGSVELAQVRLTSITAAPITAAEIYAIPNVHTERYDYPIFDENNATGTVTFNISLPLIHTGSVAKKVYASYAEPVFSVIPLATEFVAPEETFSSSSTQIYGGTVGSSSKSLGAGSFTAYLKSGIADPLLELKGKNLWFKFTPDKYQGDYLLCQGILGISRTFPAADNITAKCTISPFKPAINRVL